MQALEKKEFEDAVSQLLDINLTKTDVTKNNKQYDIDNPMDDDDRETPTPFIHLNNLQDGRSDLNEKLTNWNFDENFYINITKYTNIYEEVKLSI